MNTFLIVLVMTCATFWYTFSAYKKGFPTGVFVLGSFVQVILLILAAIKWGTEI